MPAAPTPNKNWLLIKLRKWHSWGGVFLAAFILLVATTGIILNHKGLLLPGEKKEGASGALTAGTDLSALPITFERALEISRAHLGDGPIEKIELKDEGGWLVYKIRRGPGEEVNVDARTGEVSARYAGRAGAGTNWGKLVDELHTGKILGTPGKLLIDVTSGVIIALTLSGLYLWWVPLARKRRTAAEAARKKVQHKESAQPEHV